MFNAVNIVTVQVNVPKCFQAPVTIWGVNYIYFNKVSTGYTDWLCLSFPGLLLWLLILAWNTLFGKGFGILWRKRFSLLASIGKQSAEVVSLPPIGGCHRDILVIFLICVRNVCKIKQTNKPNQTKNKC